MREFLAIAAGYAITTFARLLTAVRGIWDGVAPDHTQRVYYANHSSNGDFVLLWTVLPAPLRKLTRPVAAADYWLTSKLRTFIGREVFNAVLIDRRQEGRALDPMEQILEAVDEGASLIIFPEGSRNTTEELLPFKSGIYNISKQRPALELIPVWIENLNGVMPKGKIIPIPLLCSVTFGAPIRVEDGETREAFLTRAADALRATAPSQGDVS